MTNFQMTELESELNKDEAQGNFILPILASKHL